MLSKSTIDAVNQSVEIVEVINDFVPLKKRGANYTACCPFHQEKTPSFSVSDTKQIYKCFGCGKSGDAITFVMEHEGLGYIEAIKYLAGKYGIDIVEEAKTEEQILNETKKDSLYIVLNYAKSYYKSQLLETDEGINEGLSYFDKRGFSKQTIEKFDLGYSPKAWDAFTKEAIYKGYNLSYLEETGLTIVKEDSDKKYDRFRERVMFPIHNLSGKVIGFGGRILTNDKEQPKYINSPETEVYHKSNILYGIFHAKTAIRKEENCFLVEGYTDVVSLHQGGVENVVASSGTSLTVEQVRLIKRFTPNLTLLFDGDAAGLNAAVRGVEIALKEALNVQVVVFPDDEDPDSYIRKVGGYEFKKYIAENSIDFLYFKADLLLKNVGNSPVKKAEAVREIVQSLSLIDDNIKRSFYVKECAKMFQLEESILHNEINKIRVKQFYDNKNKSEKDIVENLIPAMEQKPPVKQNENPLDVSRYELEIVRLLLSFSQNNYRDKNDIISYILEHTDGIIFESETSHKFFEIIVNSLKSGEFVSVKEINESHTLNDEEKSILIDLVLEKHELSKGWEKHEIVVNSEIDFPKISIHHVVNKLKWQKIKIQIQECLKDIEKTQEEDEQHKLIKKFNKLKQVEKQFAEIFGNSIR